MTPEPSPVGRNRRLHETRLACCHWLSHLERPATLKEMVEALDDGSGDVTRAVFPSTYSYCTHPWFVGNRHALGLSWSGWEQVQATDPFAAVRRLVAHATNLATPAEALAHARAYRQSPPDEPLEINVRNAD